MAKTYNFSEMKAAKEGIITPKAVVESVIDWMENSPNKIKKIAVVVELEDGWIETALSHMNHLEGIGLFALGQEKTSEDMDE